MCVKYMENDLSLMPNSVDILTNSDPWRSLDPNLKTPDYTDNKHIKQHIKTKLRSVTLCQWDTLFLHRVH